MPHVTGFQCDHCQKTELKSSHEHRGDMLPEYLNLPLGWVHVARHTNERVVHRVNAPLTFCSWKCLAQYATGKHAVEQSHKEAPVHESNAQER